MLNSRTVNVRYALIQGLYWCINCVTLGYASFFLLQRGFSSSTIGIILALGNLASLLLQPAVAAAADRAKRPCLMQIITVLTAVSGVLFVFMRQMQSAGALLAVVFTLTFILHNSVQPLINSFAFYIERFNTAINFGISRGTGSLLYAVVSVILGYLTVSAGADIVPTAGLVLSVLFIAAMSLFRSFKKPPAGNSSHANGVSSRPGRLRLNRSTVILLAGTAILFYSHSTLNTFMMQMVSDVGGSSSQLGTLGCYTALLELPAMFLFSRLCRRFSCAGMIRCASVFFTVKNLICFLAPNMLMLYAGMFFQCLSFALFTPAAVRYVQLTSDESMTNRAQAYLTGMITAGNILSSLLSGFFIDALGVKKTLAISCVVCACGAVLLLLFLKKENTAVRR